MELKILCQDSELIACIKPAGVVSQEGGMPELLRSQCDGEIFCVHRLDRPAAGVMVYARSAGAAAALSSQIASGAMEKHYLAVVQGCPGADEGELRDLLYHDAAKNKSFVVKRQRRGVREAALRFELLGTSEIGTQCVSLLRVKLLTGRTHQIRVQFASRGMPLYGDGRYGSLWRGEELALWSECVGLDNPLTGERMTFACRPPEITPWTLFREQEL